MKEVFAIKRLIALIVPDKQKQSAMWKIFEDRCDQGVFVRLCKKLPAKQFKEIKELASHRQHPLRYILGELKKELSKREVINVQQLVVSNEIAELLQLLWKVCPEEKKEVFVQTLQQVLPVEATLDI